MKIKFLGVILYVYCFKLLKLENVQGVLRNNASQFNKRNTIFVMTLNIIQRCFNERGQDLVISGNLSSDSESILLNKLHVSSIPTSLLSLHEDYISKFLKRLKNFHGIDETIVKKRVKPARNFVIIAPTRATIIEALQRTKNSIWWNYEGVFLIVDTNFKKGCEMAHDHLKSIWSFNILSASLLCYDDASNKLSLYTYNPYSDWAPKFWKVDRRVNVDNDSTLTLFVHALNTTNYFYNSSICGNLNFIKTKNLNGYPIRIGVSLPPSNIKNVVTLSNINGINGDVARTMWNYLNATTNITVYDQIINRNYDEYTESVNFSDIYSDIFSGKIDYSINKIFLRKLWRQKTYPQESSGLCVIAPKQLIPFTARFLNVFPPKFWLTVTMLSLLAIFILKLIIKQSLNASTLEFLRMIIGVSSQRQPNTLLRRLLFTFFVITAMYANSYFQSRFNAIFIAPISVEIINTFEDLNRSKFLIHGNPNFKKFLIYDNLQNRYRDEKKVNNCIIRLKNGEEIICIYPCMAYNIRGDKRTHVAKHKMREFYMSFMIREDWPLTSRVNKILTRMTEAGLFKLFQKRQKELFLKQVVEKDKWEPIGMRKMKMCFFILGCGFSLSINVFFIEISIRKIKMIARKIIRTMSKNKR